jgi:hypothetical protein
VTLEAAHVHGKERRQIILDVISQYITDGKYQLDLDETEQAIVNAHYPISETFLFLCKNCHKQYDSDDSLVWAAESLHKQPFFEARNSGASSKNISHLPTIKQNRKPTNVPSEDYGKAKRKLPRWADNPQQANHRIIRGYLALQKKNGVVTFDSLREQCTNPDTRNTFVDPSKFYGHFQSMKTDAGKSHGKFFIENTDGSISVWDEVAISFNNLIHRFE